MHFGRIKPLDAILETAEKKSLHRSLGPVQLMLFGIGCIIGTGIFVLTAAGAQKAGPGLMLAFAIAGAVCIVAALTAFIVLTLPQVELDRFNPFLPAGVFGGFGTGVGAVGAAATIFFAYVGFDAVSTAAEETRDPQRNVPIGLVGSLLFCTVFYILVAAGAIGTIGGQPIMGPGGVPFPAGSEELARQCAMPEHAAALVCSNEALAHVLRQIGFSGIGNLLGIAAFVALPSVILVLLFAQTRIFFVMSRDGLLPEVLSKVHPKWHTPYVVTAVTGVVVAIGAAFFPVGQLADIA
ncbi:MAG: amino acid permease, partial [Parasphingopyxis sp.]|uniref:amino acid permease n=1 Tax=Parasphingopyxis sp. TaxID=1920299 RepID=UPI0032ED9A8C